MLVLMRWYCAALCYQEVVALIGAPEYMLLQKFAWDQRHALLSAYAQAAICLYTRCFLLLRTLPSAYCVHGMGFGSTDAANGGVLRQTELYTTTLQALKPSFSGQLRLLLRRTLRRLLLC